MTASTETKQTAPVRLKNTALSHLRGFNYHPSFCAHGIVRWLDRYDAATVRAEVERSKDVFPWINILRVWLSHDAWMLDRARFLANLRSEMALYRELGIGVMPVLFNGATLVPDYGSLHPVHATLCAKPENMRRIVLDYVRDVFEACAPEAQTVRIAARPSHGRWILALACSMVLICVCPFLPWLRESPSLG